MLKRSLSLFLSFLFLFALFSLTACGEDPAVPTADSSVSATTGSASSQTETTLQSNSGSQTAATDSGTAGSGTTQTTSGTAHTSDPVELDGYSKHPDYADVNFGGKTFTFATTGIDCFGEFCETYEITAELTGSDNLINEAVDKRNKLVESLYNCKIAEEKCAAAADVIANDLSLGLCNHEFCMPLWQNTWWNNDKYFEMTSIGIDLSHSWWNQDYVNAFAEYVNGTPRFQTLSGKFNLITYDMIYGVIVNMDLYEQLYKNGDITIDIFEEARRGTWTMDKMLEAATPANKDVNGNSVLSTEDGDIVGLALDNGNWVPARAFYYGFGGISTTRNEEGGLVSVDANNTDINKLSEIIDGVLKVHLSEAGCMMGESKVYESISNGQSLFAPYYFRSVMLSLSSQDIRLSVVPYPKLNESQERYYNYVVNRCYGVKVAKTVKNPTEASSFLEVFGFHSEKIVFPDYVNYIATQCFCNEEAREMLDIIYNTLSFDHCRFASGGIEGNIASMVQKEKNNISRALTSIASTYNSVITPLYDLAKASVS